MVTKPLPNSARIQAKCSPLQIAATNTAVRAVYGVFGATAPYNTMKVVMKSKRTPLIVFKTTPPLFSAFDRISQASGVPVSIVVQSFLTINLSTFEAWALNAENLMLKAGDFDLSNTKGNTVNLSDKNKSCSVCTTATNSHIQGNVF